VAGVSTGQPRLVTKGGFERDLGPRVASTHDQDAALPKLRWVPVFRGVHLHDGRIELGCERGNPGGLVGARRHHHLLGLESAVAGRRDEPVPLLGEPVHSDTGSNRQIEP